MIRRINRMKRLHRSNNNRILAGVCAGIAETYDLDPSIVRIIFGVVSCMSGIGIIAYIIAALVMPYDEY